MMLERIVCGVDGSEAGFEALRQARTLLAPGGRLVAVTALEEHLAVHAGMQAPKVLDELRAEAEATRQAAERFLAGLEETEAVVVAGRPNDVLASVAAREQADLVAVGTHGTSRRAGILLGSVATTMLHGAPSAVLVARPGSEADFPAAIVAAVDGSPESAEAAEIAADLANRFGASLRVVSASGGRGGADPAAVKTIAADVEVDARGPLEALESVSAGADLLVVGSRGLHGVRALGSVSERIAHRAQCSVLVVRHAHRNGNAA
jgi:nucleotide-binding universal stress UspA family protein